jgi:hypothetical protein
MKQDGTLTIESEQAQLAAQSEAQLRRENDHQTNKAIHLQHAADELEIRNARQQAEIIRLQDTIFALRGELAAAREAVQS